MMISSPTYATTLANPQTEKWYGTQYQIVPMDDKLKAQWQSVQASKYPALHLPQVNDMIATEFDLLSEKLRTSVPTEAPQCILLEGANGGTKTSPSSSSSSSVLELWYKPDNVFEMPKVNIMYNFC